MSLSRIRSAGVAGIFLACVAAQAAEAPPAAAAAASAPMAAAPAPTPAPAPAGPRTDPMVPADVPIEPAQAIGLEPPPMPPLATKRGERLKVTDPYLEMHTGAGRGYPVFHVVGRGEWVEVVLRHTDWYEVRTVDGKLGWVHRKQLETTLTDSGGTKTFRDLLLDDYLARRVEMGAAYGRFHSEPMIKMWAAWRFAGTLSLEGTYAQVQGAFSGTDLWHVDLHEEPWSDRRLSPYVGIGFGHFRNIPNLSLVSDISTSARLADASIGARWHISDRFVLRTDYTLYLARLSDTTTTQYHAATLGLSFFF